MYDSSKKVAVHERSYSHGEKVMELAHYLPIIKTKPRVAKNALVVRKLPEGFREFAKILLLNLEFKFEDREFSFRGFGLFPQFGKINSPYCVSSPGRTCLLHVSSFSHTFKRS